MARVVRRRGKAMMAERRFILLAGKVDDLDESVDDGYTWVEVY